MIIREAGTDDLNQLSLLFDSYRQFYRKQPDVISAGEFLEQRLTRKESIIFVAEESQTLLGFAQLYPLFSSTRLKRLWLLNDLFVHADHRRKGIARMLLERCSQLVNGTGACGMMLETERTNTIANQLYKQTGFQLVENNFYFLGNSNSS
jgi:ribosomal protein S18 acetylase RimI-like enzyme